MAAQDFDAGSPKGSPKPSAPKGRLALFVPLVIFLGVAVALGWGLTRNAGELPSTLIGKPIPDFSLPPVQGRSLGLSSQDLVGQVSLVNFWASWCAPCRREKPLFMRLRKAGVVQIHGINYKDDPTRAAEFLDTHGDAYTRTGADPEGRIGIEWGVYGLPETFVIDKKGLIRHRHVGELTAAALEKDVLPLVRKLQQE